eukprot:750144-Hanusia_phi.AAC.1
MDPDVSDIMSDSDESSTELSHLNWASHLRDDKTIAGDVQEVFVKFFKGGGARKVTTTTLQEVEDEIARFSADDLPSLKKFLQRRREKRNSRPAHVELDESLPSHRRALLSCDPPDKLRSKKTSSGKVLKMEEDLPGLNLCEDVSERSDRGEERQRGGRERGRGRGRGWRGLGRGGRGKGEGGREGEGEGVGGRGRKAKQQEQKETERRERQRKRERKEGEGDGRRGEGEGGGANELADSVRLLAYDPAAFQSEQRLIELF